MRRACPLVHIEAVPHVEEQGLDRAANAGRCPGSACHATLISPNGTPGPSGRPNPTLPFAAGAHDDPDRLACPGIPDTLLEA